MPFSRTDYVNLLRSQAGYHEGRDPSGNWNNQQRYSPAVPGLEWSQGQAWCHVFVSWGADELGARDRIPITASCAAGVAWWKARNRWTDYPVLGAPFYMGSAGQDHVGVVTAFDADRIWTIEGNTNDGGSYQGDGVYRRVRPRRGAGSPYGYGIPQFDEATVSADPALGGTGTASVPEQPVNPIPSEEDAVSLTPQQAAQLSHVATYGGWAYKGTGKVDAWGLLNILVNQQTAMQAAVAALAKAVGDNSADVDTDRLIAAVQRAIADSVVNVAVTVSDDTTPGA